MVKRTKESLNFKDSKRLATAFSKAPEFKNDYNGYYPDTDSIGTIKLSDINAEEFHEKYIKFRKPVIIEGVIEGVNLDDFSTEKIVDTLKSNDLLLVEKRFKGGFGSGTERIKMTFEEFMSKVEGKDGDQYYLTTQYIEDDPDQINETLQQLKEDERDEPVEDNEDEEDEEEDESDAKAAAMDFPQLANAGEMSDFSDTESIDMSNLHDDFEDSDEDSNRLDDFGGLVDEETISNDLPTGPLSITEARTRLQELLQKPLTNLIESDSFPLQPYLFKRLFTQQINLWIGSANPTDNKDFKIKTNEDDYGLGRRVFGGGISSGLHHDHADNLYIPIKGSKRFTIFSPSDADKMYTVGQISHVFDSGIIDYKNNENAPGWRTLRSDGGILTEVAKWKLDNIEELTREEKDELIDLIEEEEETLKDFETKVIDSEGVKKDPPSFSKVPASIVHLDKIQNPDLRAELLEFAESKWPSFFNAKRMTGFLKPGQMLYLPTGWFHEVTSFGDNANSKTHIALNYWYIPPSDPEEIYQDKYWENDYERTLKSCEYIKNNPDSIKLYKF